MNRLPFCAQVGALIGVVAGFLFGTWQFQECCGPPTPADLASAILMIAAVALLTALFVLCVLRGYTLASVFVGALVNAALVTTVVVLVLNAIAPSSASIILGVIIGLLIGIIVGWVLCFLCGDRFSPTVPRG